MIAVIENSPSIIYHATHILHLRIQASQAAEWVPAPVAGVMRTANLDLNALAVFKGRTRQRPGENVQVDIVQYGTGMSRKFAVPGVWSPVSIESGTDLLAFCRFSATSAADTAALLNEASCELVVPAGSALIDVELALEIENANSSPANLFKLIGERSADINIFFAEYLWARLREPVLSNIKTFDLLVNYLADAQLSPIARSALLDLIYSNIYGSAAATEEYTCHLGAGLFRLLELPQAEQLHANIVGVFLSNLLGLSGGADRCHPDDIFAPNPKERELASLSLQKYSGTADVKPLQEWLK